MPRFYVNLPLLPGACFALPESAARHVQVLRLQPGDALTVFNGVKPENSAAEGEYAAVVTQMGRREVSVCIGAFQPVQREAAWPMHIAIGMPANERMDWLVEKAAELGAASITPLVCERSVLRLGGERAEKKVAHWRGVATAACEQSGRCRVLHIHPVQPLTRWLGALPAMVETRWLLSLQADSAPLWQAAALAGSSATAQKILFLSGPEGGLSPAEEAAARLSGFAAVSLGSRVLRSETAPLAVLAALGLMALPV